MEFHIDFAQDADSDAVREVLTAAFPDQAINVVNLVHDLLAHHAASRSFGLVVRHGEEIIGHTLVTENYLDAARQLVNVAVLAPVAVVPRFQRQGVGRALVARARELADEAGWPALFVEGDPRYYSKLGFLAANNFGMRKPSLRIPDDAFQIQLLSSYEPWMTGTLVYIEPFWVNDSVGLRD